MPQIGPRVRGLVWTPRSPFAVKPQTVFPGYAIMKVRDIRKMLEEDRWYRVKAKGGHWQ